MKSVLISINPKWCELIASGKKTVEVKKTKPQLKTPFKVYIYETKGEKQYYSQPMPIPYYKGKGKVIGEFVCVKIDTVMSVNTPCMIYFSINDKMDVFFSDVSCLDVDEAGKYLGFNTEGYGWHISDLVIYDEPKELDRFLLFCEYDFDEVKCIGCKNLSYNDLGQEACDRRITRPPQSWCYVEELI